MRKQVFATVISFVFILISSNSWAGHASVSAGMGHGGPVTTVSAKTMKQGMWHLELLTEFQKFDTFSDSELLEFVDRGEEDIHNVDYLWNTFVGLAYGMTDDFTLHLRIPYVIRNDISEIHHEEEEENGHGDEHAFANGGEEEEDIERLGDASGIGDLTVFGHYRLPVPTDIGFESSLLVGLKVPTGRTSNKDDEGSTFEAEFQPGSGSWDPMFGIAVTKPLERSSIDANILYTLITEGTQDTDLGDVLNFNLAFTHRVVQGAPAIDVIIEANTLWKAKEEVNGEKDKHSGGTIVFLSPGVRVNIMNRLNAVLSIGIPVIQDLNGEQNEIDYRIVTGINFMI
jgi:hypothetical protein